MQKVLIGLFSGVLIIGVGAAQNTAPSAPPPGGQSNPAQVSPSQSPQPGNGVNASGGAMRIAPGSVIPVLLTKTVDAKKAKTGDPVTAKVAQDLKNSGGGLIMAKDTELMGHITEAQPRNKEQKESQLGISFDRAVMKNGSEMPLRMSIQAIIGAENNAPQDQSSGSGGAAQPSTAAGTSSSPGRGMSGGGSAPASQLPSGGANSAPDSTTTRSSPTSRPQITAQTQGVIGISNLKLEAASTPAQGSLLSSEKNNVKLENGTMMLLRVNQ
jgi:hypothetical protein